MDNANSIGGTGVRAVGRALEILLAWRDGETELSAAELLTRVKLSRPTLYRLLYTLEGAGFVRAVGEPQRFRLGPSVAQLARVWGTTKDAPVDIPTAAQPMMRALWESTAETVGVFVADGIDRVCVAELASPQALSFKRGVGHRERLMLGASGRTILAHLPHAPSDLRRYAKDLPLRNKLDLQAYAAELDATRKRGWAVSRSELIEGAVAMAAPFFQAGGQVAGSLAVFGPSVRLDHGRVKNICELLTGQARLLSAALGHA